MVGTTIVVQAHGDRRRTIRVRGWRVSQRAVGGDARLHREQSVVVVADQEIERLTRLVAGRPLRQSRGPTADGLRSRILVHRLIRAFGEGGRIVDRVHGDGDGDHIGIQMPVVGRVSEMIFAIEVVIGRVDEATILGERHRSVSWPVHDDGGQKIVRIVIEVVVQHAIGHHDGQIGIFIRRVTFAGGDGRFIDESIAKVERPGRLTRIERDQINARRDRL